MPPHPGQVLRPAMRDGWEIGRLPAVLGLAAHDAPHTKEAVFAIGRYIHAPALVAAEDEDRARLRPWAHVEADMQGHAQRTMIFSCDGRGKQSSLESWRNHRMIAALRSRSRGSFVTDSFGPCEPRWTVLLEVFRAVSFCDCLSSHLGLSLCCWGAGVDLGDLMGEDGSRAPRDGFGTEGTAFG